MSTPTNTALVLIDPLNDFLHSNGKLYPRMKASLESSNSLEHIKQLLTAARAASIPVFYGLHQMTKEGSYKGWNHMNLNQTQSRDVMLFDENFGGHIFEGLEPQPSNGDVVVSRHWNSRYGYAWS